jgi:penicillin-binding protein 1A
VIAAARDLGIDASLQPLPSMALGAVGLNLLDLTSAFASVRADRMRVRPWGIAAAGPDNGAMRVAGPPLISPRTLDPYQKPLVDLLRGVVEHGTGRAAAVGSFAAGKTGTSQDYRDAWFIGFNDALVVGVWVGNDDNSPMKGVVGGSLPATIWRKFVSKATPLVGREPTPVSAAAPAWQSNPPAPPADQTARPSPDQPSANRCDVQACSSKYSSFSPSDCTYQPYDGGPRRLCEKGDQAWQRGERPPGATDALGQREEYRRPSRRHRMRTPRLPFSLFSGFPM